MNRLIAPLFLLVCGSASAVNAPMVCSIHPKANATTSDLKALAKVSLAQARKAAIASLRTKTAIAVKDGELEVEHDCLVYSFDLGVHGKTGIEEIMVDAGNGKVLSRDHESPPQESAEHKKEMSEKMAGKH